MTRFRHFEPRLCRRRARPCRQSLGCYTVLRGPARRRCDCREISAPAGRGESQLVGIVSIGNVVKHRERANETFRQQLTADARSAVGSMVATSVPLLSRIALTIVAASLSQDATGALGPSLWNPTLQPNFNRTETLKITQCTDILKITVNYDAQKNFNRATILQRTTLPP
jgi:hypothetical protein